MRKFFAIFAAAALVLSLAACNNESNNGGNNNSGDGSSSTTSTTPEEKSEESSTTPEETPDESGDDTSGEEEPPVLAGVADPEDITADPLVYLSFDDEESVSKLTAVHQVANTEDPNLTGATYALVDSVHEILIADGYGAVGNSLMLDGKYGVKVNDMPQTSGDSYTIAFWYAADRYSQFGPLLQIGRNVGMNDQENEVAWINFTKTDTWSITGEECAPVAWNRNSGENTWPWIGNNLDLLGKREWVHVALVADGTIYTDSAGLNHVGATFYVNGIPVMTASEADIGLFDETGVPIINDWKGISANILKGDGVYGVECLMGVNYWDQYSKEYIDEFYLFDEALTAGQIATLYNQGNPPEYETMPAYDGPVDDTTEG